MKKTLILLACLASGLAVAEPVCALFDLDESVLTEQGATSVTLDDGGITLELATTVSAGLGSGTTTNTFAADNAAALAEINTFAMLNGTSKAFTSDMVSTYVSAGSKAAGSNLTVTLSGLVADNSYTVVLVTGCNWESAGAWNNVNTTNTYASANPTLGEQAVKVNNLTAYEIKDIVADAAGKITLTINNTSGAHTATLNAISVTPEPATATLSLLALAGLAARRRRH